MFIEGNSLLMKVGVIMMALALVITGVVVSATLRSKPDRMVAAEVATKSPGEAPRYSSGEEGSATKNSSSEKESSRYLSSGPVEQRKEEAKEPQALLQQEAEGSNSQSATPQPAGGQTTSEAFSGPQPQPYQQEQPLPGAEQRDWPKPTQGELTWITHEGS